MIANLLSSTPHQLGRLSKSLLSTVALIVTATTLSHAQTVQTLSPENNGAPAPAGDLALQITYDVDVSVGTGNVTVTDINTSNVIATFDITDPADATVSGNTVTFATFPAVGGAQYNIEAPQGFVVVTVGGTPAPGFGFNPGDGIWLFNVVAPDTTAPALESTSPQNGTGASTSSTLSATFDENVSLGTGPWTITVFDITGNQLVESFTDADTSSIEAVGTQLSFTLASSLAFNNEYRVTFTENVVMDSAGNLSAEIASGDWQFTTGDPFASGQVVISQVHGGGGNSGAFYTNDFIELYNLSGSAISLDGWSVQYSSSGGSSWTVTPLTGTIQPGGYFLVQQNAGANTAGTSIALPTPDATGEISMSGSNGKVALSNSITAYAVADPNGDSSLSDLVGYGSANAFEGSGATASLSNTIAAIRRVAGSQDTNDNAADFTTGSPAPRNSASPAFVPGADGSGIAIASNATPGAGSLIGSGIFPSMGTAQSLQINLAGSFTGATLTDVEVDVPADFGVPQTGNVVLSGTAAGSGTATANGQTVSISGVSITDTDSLNIVISGLSAPDVSAVPSDDGNRAVTVRTAASGGTLTGLVSSPSVRVAMTVTDLATLRAIGPGGTKAYILASEAIVTHLADGNFRNQHWIQDSTGGILIDDQSVTLGTTFAVGDGLVNLVGAVSEFRGLLQFNPIAATASVNSTSNTPAPIELTLAQLSADPLTYQSRLVKVIGVAFNPATGDFANNSEHILSQGGDAFSFSSFFNADYVGTTLPANTLDLVGLVLRLGTSPDEDFLSPRSLADFTIGDPQPGSTYQGFADQFAGGQTDPTLDFDGDGVRNGLEYLFGVDSAGFTATPQIVNGEISWPIDPTRTDVGYLVQTSINLVDWNPVLAGDLDLTDPNAVTYTVPTGTDPFFVRIGATFAPTPP